MHREAGNETIETITAGREEGGIQSAVGRELGKISAATTTAREAGEVTREEQIAGRIHRHRTHRAVEACGGHETGVQRAVGVQARHLAARRAVDVVEVTGHIDLAVIRARREVHRHRTHLAIRAGKAVQEGRVHTAIHGQPRDAAAAGAVDRREETDHKHTTIRVHGHTIDSVVRARQTVLESRVERAVR